MTGRHSIARRLFFVLFLDQGWMDWGGRRAEASWNPKKRREPSVSGCIRGLGSEACLLLCSAACIFKTLSKNPSVQLIDVSKNLFTENRQIPAPKKHKQTLAPKNNKQTPAPKKNRQTPAPKKKQANPSP